MASCWRTHSQEKKVREKREEYENGEKEAEMDIQQSIFVSSSERWGKVFFICNQPFKRERGAYTRGRKEEKTGMDREPLN